MLHARLHLKFQSLDLSLSIAKQQTKAVLEAPADGEEESFKAFGFICREKKKGP